MAQTITVTIDNEANATVTTSGFAGKACLEATAQLEAALGHTEALRLAPEFYRGTSAAHTVTTKG